MARSEAKNVPMLAGWVIGIGAGAVAFGVSVLAIGLGIYQGLFIGTVILLVVGFILGMPAAERPAPEAPPAPPPPASRPLPAAAAAPAAVVTAPLAPSAIAAARPAGLAAPRGGVPDDLKRIKGIGPKLEEMLHSMGYYHYDQIAAWTPAEVAWVDDNLEGFKGRVTRDEWVAQAKVLAAGGSTGSPARSETG